MKAVEKIAICKTLIEFYESDNEDKYQFGMCKLVQRLVELQINERGGYYKGLLFHFVEFTRHPKFWEPVMWWDPLDYQSRINYLEETINIIESKLDLKIDKVNNLLHQAAKDRNFLKVSQAKVILTELNNIKNELQNN
jgi:hypothetical protein